VLDLVSDEDEPEDGDGVGGVLASELPALDSDEPSDLLGDLLPDEL
jgi:hypothetical protein